MTDTQRAAWLRRQPDNLNGLRPNGFKFLIHAVPHVEYFCQSAPIPQIISTAATLQTPFVTVKEPGEIEYFAPLNIEFLINEDMTNWSELYHWFTGLYFPDSRQQFKNLRAGEPPNSSFFDSEEEIYHKVGPGEKSDATVVILGSNNEPVANVIFSDVFPVALSGLDFTTKIDDIEYFGGRATFEYTSYRFERVV